MRRDPRRPSRRRPDHEIEAGVRGLLRNTPNLSILGWGGGLDQTGNASVTATTRTSPISWANHTTQPSPPQYLKAGGAAATTSRTAPFAKQRPVTPSRDFA